MLGFLAVMGGWKGTDLKAMRRTFWLLVGLLWPLYLFDAFLGAIYITRVTTPPPPEIHFSSPCFGKVPAQNPECRPDPWPSVDPGETPVPTVQPSAPYR